MSRDTSAYTVGGQRVVSVTEALTLAGLIDFSGVPPETLELARQRGTDVHSWLDGLDSGLLTSTLLRPPERIAGYVEAWVRFKHEARFVPLEVEVARVHDAFAFAGTPDRFGLLDGEKAVVEIKAVATLAPWVALQTAGYDLLLDVGAGQGRARRRLAVQLMGDGTYRLDEHRAKLEDRRGFLGALALAQWRRARGVTLPPNDDWLEER